MEFLLLMILLMLCIIVIAMPRPLSLREQSDRQFDAYWAGERARNPPPRVPAFGWPRTFYLKDSERAFLQDLRQQPWGLFAIALAILIATLGLRYLGLI